MTVPIRKVTRKVVPSEAEIPALKETTRRTTAEDEMKQMKS